MKVLETIKGRFSISKTESLRLRRRRRSLSRGGGAYTILCIVWLLLTGSCQSFLEPLSHAEITSNLSKEGSTDYALLSGEWEPVRFAYTADGEKITHAVIIHNDLMLYINDLGLFFDDEFIYLHGPWEYANRYLFYANYGDEIRFSRFSEAEYEIDIHITGEGYSVLNALTNLYSFVVRDNELILYFTGVENRNLLILKKR